MEKVSEMTWKQIFAREAKSWAVVIAACAVLLSVEPVLTAVFGF